MVTPVGISGASSTGTTNRSDGASQDKPSAIDTLAQKLGIPPEMLTEMLKGLLEQKQQAEPQKSGGSGGQCGGGSNPSGIAGDLNLDGVVDMKDLEMLAQQVLDGKTQLPGTGAIDSGCSTCSAGSGSAIMA